MYGGKGRSGHHREYVGNHWQDWDGVSPNGRQFKNAFTQEVRDLSGSEYWKARKANNPSECDLQHHFNQNGSANIRAYAEADKPKTRTKAKPKSAFERVNLADAHYSRLEKLSQELDAEYEQGLLSHEDWAYARRQLDKRLDAGWVRVCKARGWRPEERDEEIFYRLNLKALTAKQQASTMPTSQQESSVSWSDEWLASTSDENCFKRPLQIVLTSWKRAAKVVNIIKQAIKQMEGIN